VGEQIDCQTRGSERDDDLSCDSGHCLDQDDTTHQGRETVTECSDSFVARLLEWAESELEEEQRQVIQDGIPISSPGYSTQEVLVDDVICDVLSNYPLSPIGDLRSFQCIVQALLFAFSPLPSPTLAALLGFEDARHVKRILLPASPLIFIPKSEEDNEDDDDRIPIKFIQSSIVDFFLDRMRSRDYYVDGPRAHRMLLERCTSVMEDVYGKGSSLGMIPDWWWRDAFEYACQNWERHRRAGTRSKL
jgi:hypothetical protein